MQKKIYIYSVFIRSGCASGEKDLRGKREPETRSFLREITLFLNLRTVRSTTNKIVKKLHSAIRCQKCIRLTSQWPEKPSNLSGRHHSIPREIL